MGLPVKHFIAATNANDIVPQYLATGEFTPRPSVATISNAMDVGHPSNFARIMDIYNDDLELIRQDISGYSISDADTAACIKKVYDENGYLMCPHTAVGYLAMERFLETAEKPANAIVLGTAHPVKFGEVVEPLIGRPVEIPERLQSMLGTEKLSIPMGSDFESFKSWLLG